MKMLIDVMRRPMLSALAVCLTLMVYGYPSAYAQEATDKPIGESWDYTPSMKKIAAGYSETEQDAMFYGTAARVYRIS